MREQRIPKPSRTVELLLLTFSVLVLLVILGTGNRAVIVATVITRMIVVV
jgi:hypothetical protein